MDEHCELGTCGCGNEALEKRMALAIAKAEASQPHKTRFSDSSLYDEVCTLCGATDANGMAELNRPCPAQK